MCQRANVASRCASSAVIMDSTPSWLVTGATASAALVAAAILRYLLSTRRPKGFPPGPPTLFGVGNLHQIPIERPFIKFHEWAETYGDIIGLKVGPANLVVLHDPQYVRELLDRRGAIYSGRPYSYIPSEHVFAEHGDKHILNLQNGPYLRRWRSAVAYLVGPAGLKQTLPMQEATSATLVKKLLQTPSDFPDHIKNWALATPLLVITGQKLDDREKGFLDRFFNAQKKWLELLEPGNAPPVDIFPFLRWAPFADWKKKAKYVRDYMLEEYEGFFQTAKALSSDIGGEAPASQSLMTKIIEDQDKEVKPANRFTHDEIAFMGGGLLDAAVDTWSTILSFIMFMATYPDMQAKVQKEIDSVSPGQPPGGDIIDRLPYTRACLFEVFRLRPPTPNGLPHVLDRDDTFHGYKIPKGTTVLANVWGIQQREEDYDEPEKFKPERYLAHPAGLRDSADATKGQRPTYTFGAGRRICPGEQFAQNSVLVAVAKLLWTFDIVVPEPLDTSIETAFNTGLVLSPNPFKVDFVVRDETKKEAVI
ncbi:hypothetical protein VUR80DRAFT_1165 [Thermomyces stellatus]